MNGGIAMVADPSTPIQPELPLPFPELSGDVPLLPARMINEFAYCPRLAYLEWVQGEWQASGDTVEGKHVHRRVDQRKGDLPPADEAKDGERIHAKSITLSSNRLGLIARMDLIEGEGSEVSPVDYKRGKRPHVARGAYAPERIQLGVQALILEEHGYTVDEGWLYFSGSKERVKVAIDAELRAETVNAVNGLRGTALTGHIPPPLVDSPKCPRCSLVEICLPDEVSFLRKPEIAPRPLAIGLQEALPLCVQANRAHIGKDSETLKIRLDDESVQKVRLVDVSQLVIMGSASITTPALQELMKREIPVSWHSYGGWFVGHTVGTGHKNVELRTAQYKASFDERTCLRLARGLVNAKIRNGRTLLRRNWRGEETPDTLLQSMKEDAERATRARSLEELLGIEGAAAARFFGAFPQLIKQEADAKNFAFDFTKRNRRPPTDPVNALLSYAYAMLTRTWTVTLTAVGFDAYRGYYHQPRYGRPALALDMMEPFRPLIADSAVLMAINNAEVRPTDFVAVGGSVSLKQDGRRRFISRFERRLQQEVTHPLFGYKLSYRRLMELQARLLGRFLLEEIPDYPNFTTR